LRGQGCPWDASTTSLATRGGQLKTLQWLLDQNCPYDNEMAYEAAESGYLVILQWLDNNNYSHIFDTDTMCAAMFSRDIEILQWLLEKNCPYNKEEMWDVCSESNDIELFVWAQKNIV